MPYTKCIKNITIAEAKEIFKDLACLRADTNTNATQKKYPIKGIYRREIYGNNIEKGKNISNINKYNTKKVGITYASRLEFLSPCAKKAPR